jgi:hypothetical protein
MIICGLLIFSVAVISGVIDILGGGLALGGLFLVATPIVDGFIAFIITSVLGLSIFLV